VDKRKFQNTVLYLLRRCATSHPGVTSLLKMLYFADYEHYRQFLRPITGAEYVALERGPVVNDYKMLFEQLVTEGVVKKHEASVLGIKEKKIEYRPLQEPDTSVFASTELAILDHVAEQFGSETGLALSEKTHLEGPWSLVWDWRQPGRSIPYMLFRWLDNLPDEADVAEARKQIAARPKLLDRIRELNSAASS
jgi:uncharacterized phage-associated protein